MKMYGRSRFQERWAIGFFLQALSLCLTLSVVRGASHPDLDGDGIAEVILQHQDGSIGAWFVQTFQLKSATYLDPVSVGDPRWVNVGAADFNGDGSSDLLFQHADGTIAVWFMSQAKLTSASFLNPSQVETPNYRVAAVGDINQDTKPDLVFQHADGTFLVWLMDSVNLTSTQTIDPPRPDDPTNWQAVGGGDFNGDGKLDLALQHTDGTLAVWLLDGTKLTRGALLEPPFPGTGWRLITTAELDGKGSTDLVFQNTDGTIAAWYIDGTRLHLGAVLEPSHPGPGWWVAGPNSFLLRSPAPDCGPSLARAYYPIEAATEGVVVPLELRGVPPYRAQLVRGALPKGLTLTENGQIIGIAEQLGRFEIVAQVTDANNQTADLPLAGELFPPPYNLPTPGGERVVTEADLTVISNDARFQALNNLVLERNLTPVLRQTSAITAVANGRTFELFVIPLMTAEGKPAWAAIVLHGLNQPGQLAVAYIVQPSGTQPTITWLGTTGGIVQQSYNQHGMLLNANVVNAGGDDGAWEQFKKWLSSESGAEDLPWWLDLLCGLVCGDALVGTHNPWSISACLHCVAAYIAACVTI